MREIKFKAKRKDNNGWVYGYYWKENNNACFEEEYKEKHYIRVQQNFDWGIYMQQDFEVIPETICEYTSLKDKNGVEIYENDIGYYNWNDNKILMKIIFQDGEFLMSPIEKSDFKTWDIRISGYNKNFEKIGNIYDKEVE